MPAMDFMCKDLEHYSEILAREDRVWDTYSVFKKPIEFIATSDPHV